MNMYHTSLRRPNINDPVSWRAYWQAQGQSWRTEPEIALERQKYLDKCLQTVIIDLYSQGHPFKNITLCRADVEWLLATNDDEHRPVDLYSADLRKADLHSLPLEGADLSAGHLEGANLVGTHLERADLNRAYLEGAILSGIYLERADLREANLEGVDLRDAYLEWTDLNRAHLVGADLSGAHLERAVLTQAHLERANLKGAHLERAFLSQAHLERASLYEVHLEGANLSGAHLEGANLNGAHLEGANLKGAHLEASDLSGVFLTSATDLRDILLGNEQTGFASLAGVYWSDADLTVVDWTQLNILGDEQQAKQRYTSKGEMKDSMAQLQGYRTAVRANRQLAVALQEQGLNEEAAYFAYRAQRLQRVVLRQQRKVGLYLFSLFLDLLAGYGYRLGRSLIAYLIIIIGFMGLYLLNAHFVSPHLRWDEALVLSLSSFHGRGFFSQDIALGDTYARLAAAEAVVGLLIEVSLIATFTQRFFGK